MKARITKIEDKIEAMAPWVYLLLIILAVLASSILLGFVVHQQKQIKHTAAAIQQERIDSIFRACSDQNERHYAAVKALNALLKKSGVSETRRNKSRETILTFINTLAPKRDCYKLVGSSVSVSAPTRPH